MQDGPEGWANWGLIIKKTDGEALNLGQIREFLTATVSGAVLGGRSTKNTRPADVNFMIHAP